MRFFAPSGREGESLPGRGMRGLRSPAPCGYFLCKQKVTKKLPKPRVLDSYFLICFALEAGSGVSKLVLAAYLDFCVCLGVFLGKCQYLEEQTAVPL